MPGCVEDHWPITPNVVEVAATQPAAPGARPLFVRTLPMVWCKHCDGPPVAPGESTQALALELLARGFAVTSACRPRAAHRRQARELLARPWGGGS